MLFALCRVLVVLVILTDAHTTQYVIERYSAREEQAKGRSLSPAHNYRDEGPN